MFSSFCRRCEDLALTCITAGLPPVCADAAIERYLNAMTGLLRGQRPVTTGANNLR